MSCLTLLSCPQIHNGPPHSSNFGYSYAKRMIDVQNRCGGRTWETAHGLRAPSGFWGEGSPLGLPKTKWSWGDTWAQQMDMVVAGVSSLLERGVTEACGQPTCIPPALTQGLL